MLVCKAEQSEEGMQKQSQVRAVLSSHTPAGKALEVKTHQKKKKEKEISVRQKMQEYSLLTPVE